MKAPTHIINALNAAQWQEFVSLVEAGYLTPEGKPTLKGKLVLTLAGHPLAKESAQ